MVPLPNANGAHYDSVKSENTVSSKSIQMDVKIPVQPSNFDDLQKGALLGASIFMKHDKTYYYQPSYTVEFIPSPGTIFKEPSLWLGFCFSGVVLFIDRLAPTSPSTKVLNNQHSAGSQQDHIDKFEELLTRHLQREVTAQGNPHQHARHQH